MKHKPKGNYYKATKLMVAIWLECEKMKGMLC